MNIDKATTDLMDKRPGKVSKLIPIRKRFCVDQDRAALAYAIWLNSKLPEPDVELIQTQRMELLSMSGRSYAWELSSTMWKAMRMASDVALEFTGHRFDNRDTHEQWEVVKKNMPQEGEVLNTGRTDRPNE